jgi:tRNA pseudouridine38-40 synthase
VTTVLRVIKLTVAYDGTPFVGWQRQENGVSIQQLLEEALEPVEGGPVTVVGAGRTDAGVHALGQVASARLTRAIDPATLGRALNARLPADIRVLHIADADSDFNARFAARAKTYRYRILNAPVQSPFERHYAWHVPQPLDRDAMRAAAAPLAGTHDFAAFQAAGSPVATTERTVFSIECRDAECSNPSFLSASSRPLLEIDVRGDGFLRHMVRNIAGTLVEVGLGRRAAGSMAEVLASRDRSAAGATAPAHGLFLVEVEY